MMKLFTIKRDERTPAIIAAIAIIVMNVLHIAKYWNRLTVVAEEYHDIFWHTWNISGYDSITYCTISSWDVTYEVYRHPLMAFLMWLPAVVNGALISLTGINCAIIIVGVVWSICAFYAFVFLWRILREVMHLRMADAAVLTLLFYGFGYTMLSTFVSDHFGPSMMVLLLTIYISCSKMDKGKTLCTWHTICLFVLTAGITLSNGVKTFIAALFSQRREFFRPRRLLCYALASALLFGVAYAEEQAFIIPKREAAKAAEKERNRQEREALTQAVRDTISNKDEKAVKTAVNAIIKQRAREKFRWNHKQMWNVNKGKPMGDGKFSSWTDVSTPRWSSTVENVFGEPVQFHEDYFLGDATVNRPALVYYRHWYNYLAEGLLILLLVAGITVGRREKVVQMTLAFVAFDFFIHVVLGFGLNEVYIMSPHYLFLFPLCMAPLLKASNGTLHTIALASVATLALWCMAWNGRLLIPFLMQQL